MRLLGIASGPPLGIFSTSRLGSLEAEKILKSESDCLAGSGQYRSRLSMSSLRLQSIRHNKKQAYIVNKKYPLPLSGNPLKESRLGQHLRYCSHTTSMGAMPKMLTTHCMGIRTTTNRPVVIVWLLVLLVEVIQPFAFDRREAPGVCQQGPLRAIS